MNDGLWVVLGFVALLFILFLVYRAVTEWEVLDNERRQRERERTRDSQASSSPCDRQAEGPLAAGNVGERVTAVWNGMRISHRLIAGPPDQAAAGPRPRFGSPR